MNPQARYPWAFLAARSPSSPGFHTPSGPRFRDKFAAVVRLQPLQNPLLCLPDPFHHRDHIVAAKSLTHLDHHAFTTKIIDYSQGAYPASV
ncbi:hypothetical protein PEC301937_03970 [Pectobacterium carotovorum subsp. carotovorum]|nr:hypothetical protein PEC301937_03970 [Pectobacterium carotovorum subsp. carotovorum]